MEKLLKIADLVEMTGFSKTTIHFYTREGILSKPIKTARAERVNDFETLAS